MKATLVGTLLTVVLVRSAAAGFPPPPPDPNRSVIILDGQVSPCQFRFNPGGALDALRVVVTARNMWDDPMDACSTTVALEATGPGTSWCHCCPDRQVQISDEVGATAFTFSRIRGRGDLAVHVTVRLWSGTPYWIGTEKIEFTSNDLDASCDPGSDAVTIVDLGLWAGCLPPAPYCRESTTTATEPLASSIWGSGRAGSARGAVGPAPDLPGRRTGGSTGVLGGRRVLQVVGFTRRLQRPEAHGESVTRRTVRIE